MVKIFIKDDLLKKIDKKFPKKEVGDILRFLYSLKENPYKGKKLAIIGNVLLKELKYQNFRFYFIQTSKFIKILSKEDLKNELIKFVEMSNKGPEQQKAIDRLRNKLANFGFGL